MNFGVLRYREVVPVDIEDWASAREMQDWTIDRYERQGLVVSTIFLGVNTSLIGPPTWFETMVFGSEMETLDQDRCGTYDEAVAMHKRMVEKWST